MDWITAVVLLTISLWSSGLTMATISIENNGYRGVEVVIHKDVPENPLLLTILKSMLAESSRRIYDYTNKRAHLKEVTIVLPSTWSNDPNYVEVPEDDYLSAASVRIAPRHPVHGDTPYTFQPGECGEFGKYIHFTPEFLLKYKDLATEPILGGARPRTPSKRDTEWHNRDGLSRIFVHEWFHLRYGVFDEYGVSNHSQFKMFYLDTDGQMRPNTCPEKIRGWIRRRTARSPPCTQDSKGKVIWDCTFYPEWKTIKDKPISNASIMFMPQMISANGPCEEDDKNGRKHNPMAPNEHNLKCGGQSVRKVMEASPDFRDGSNPPKELLRTEPKITIWRQKNDTFPGYVFVLDVSVTMNGSRMNRLKLAASRALKYKVKPNCLVGMVSFAANATIESHLRPIGPEYRAELMEMIPSSVSNGTAIGGALLKGLEVLSSNNTLAKNGKLILITDGVETKPPHILNVTRNLQNENVIVYGLTFGISANNTIEELYRATGGKGWHFNSALTLDSMMDEIFQNYGPVEERPVINTNMAVKLSVNDSFTSHFHVDKDTTETIKVFVSYEHPGRSTTDGKAPLVTITSPMDKTYNRLSPEYNEDTDLMALQFTINNIESGKWSYLVQKQDRDSVVIANVIITFTPKKGAADPIRVKTWVSDVSLTYPQVTKMYAEVKQGFLPVLNANVFANVYKAKNISVRVPLRDSGKGADATANDGIYTEYYTQYEGDGRYAINILVDSDGRAVVPSTITFDPSGAPEFPHLPPEETTEDAKSSFPMTDLEKVDQEFSTSGLFMGTETPSHLSVNFQKVGDFERFSTAGTIVMSGWKAEDRIPPARINDLRVTASFDQNRTVELTWTSVGDDMTHGNATAVELRFHNDVNYLMESFPDASDNFTILNGGSLQPLEPYQVHVVRLQLPKLGGDPSLLLNNITKTEIVFFMVRTVDKANNAAKLSNIVHVHLHDRPPKLPFFNTYVIVGVGIGICISLLAIVIIVTCIAIKVRQRQNKLAIESKTNASCTNVSFTDG